MKGLPGEVHVLVNGHVLYMQEDRQHTFSANINPWVLKKNEIKVVFIPPEPMPRAQLPALELVEHIDKEDDVLVFGDESLVDMSEKDKAKIVEIKNEIQLITRLECSVPLDLSNEERYPWVPVTFPWQSSGEPDPRKSIFPFVQKVHQSMSAKNVTDAMEHSKFKIMFCSNAYQYPLDSFRGDVLATMEAIFGAGELDTLTSPENELYLFPIKDKAVYEVLQGEDVGPIAMTDDDGFTQGMRMVVAFVDGQWRWLL